MKLYDILGVEVDVSADEIKQAYKNESKKNHPDKGGDNDKMVEINKAYEVLGDVGRRDKYDKTGDESNVTFEMRFNGFVQDLFMGIVDREKNVEKVDLVSAFKDQVGMQIRGMEEGRKAVLKRVEKIQKVYNRLGEGRIKSVVKRNLDGMRMEINGIDDNIVFVKECLEVLQSEHYRFDPPEPEVEHKSNFDEMLNNYQEIHNKFRYRTNNGR